MNLNNSLKKATDFFNKITKLLVPFVAATLLFGIIFGPDTPFVGAGFVVCTFVPRPIESDPGALKVPFYHNNDDYDEVLFYHAGDFFSRDNIEAGMVTFHPAGFTHGPHPKAFKAGQEYKKKFTDEVAVMIDTRHALEFSDELDKVENKEYVYSWQEK